MSTACVSMAAPHGRRMGSVGSLVWAVTAAVLAVSSVAFGDPVAPSYVYGVNDAGELWVMGLGATPATQQLLFTGSLSPDANGLAYDGTREQLFVADKNNDLYWWQQGDSSFSLLATSTSVGLPANPINVNQQPWGAAFYSDAYWFFLGDGVVGTNTLRKVSLTHSGSGSIPAVAGYEDFVASEITGNNSFGDFAITPDGTLYAATFSSGQFYSLDLTTASSGTVGGYFQIAPTLGQDLQLSFNTDYTTLYGHNFATGQWYEVNTSTGALTQNTTSGFTTSSFRDIAGASVQAVPEPSSLVLAAIGGGIAAWQVHRRRRRAFASTSGPGSPPEGPSAPQPLA